MYRILNVLLITMLFLLIYNLRQYIGLLENQNRVLSEGLLHLSELENSNIKMLEQICNILYGEEDSEKDTELDKDCDVEEIEEIEDIENI